MPNVFVPGLGIVDASGLGFGPALQSVIASILASSQAASLTQVAAQSFAQDIAADRNPSVEAANRVLIERGIITSPIPLDPLTVLSNAAVQTPELAAFLPTNVLIGKSLDLQARTGAFLAGGGLPGRFPPGRSLQQGLPLECSGDDPSGRCIHPAVQRFTERRAAAVARGA